MPTCTAHAPSKIATMSRPPPNKKGGSARTGSTVSFDIFKASLLLQESPRYGARSWPVALDQVLYFLVFRPLLSGVRASVLSRKLTSIEPLRRRHTALDRVACAALAAGQYLHPLLV